MRTSLAVSYVSVGGLGVEKKSVERVISRVAEQVVLRM